MKKFLGVVAILVLAALAYFLLWPVPIEPVAWNAPEPPKLEGKLAVNSELSSVTRLASGVGAGPEDIAVDEQGRIYGAYDDGKIRRFDANGKQPEVFADTQGRPLGLAWAKDGSLLVADAFKGLVAVKPDSSVRILADKIDGTPILFADDVDVAEDGSIYFSDASTRFDFHEVMADISEHGGNGRLLKYDPSTGEVSMLLDGLQFANGVAVGPGGRYVLVNETGAYRTTRFWLKGPKKGESDVFYENLPGLPDGISYNGKDTFWVALYSTRSAELDYMADKPWLRKVVFRLPAVLQPAPVKYGFVLGLNENGEVVHNLQDASASGYSPITSVEQVGDELYLGSLTQPAIGRIAAPE